MKSRMVVQVSGLTLLVSVAVAVMAQERPAASSFMTLSAQAVFRDPVTGDIREPTDTERAELSRAIERERAMPPRSASARADDLRFRWHTVRLPTGVEARISAVPAQMMGYLVAERGPDGEYRVRHADGTAESARDATP